MLLSWDEIARRLDAKFEPMGPDFTAFRLRLRPTPDRLDELERWAGRPLPASFKDVAREYDFGDFGIGPTQFGTRGDYEARVREVNEDGIGSWWGKAERPSDQLLVASSDAHAVLLDLSTGEVAAFQHEVPFEQREVVAPDFSQYVRALATVFFERMHNSDPERIAAQIMAALGLASGEPYWTELAR